MLSTFSILFDCYSLSLVYNGFVDINLMRNLAKAQPLAEDLQNLVWRYGDRYAKADLVKRADLSPTISEEVILDDEYIFAWATNKDREIAQVKVAINNANSENSFVQLLGQNNLDAEGLELIAQWTLANASKVLSLFALERDMLARSTRRALIQQYIILSRADISAHFTEFNQISRKYLLVSKEDYRDALEVATWKESSLIAHSNKFLKDDALILEQLLKKVALLPEVDTITLGSPMLHKDIKSVVRDILTSSIVSEIQLNTLLHNPILTEFYPDILKRIGDKSFTSYQELTCNSSNKGVVTMIEAERHVEILESIVAQRIAINFPRFDLAFEAIKHRDALATVTFDTLTSNILGEETKTLLNYLATNNDVDSLLAFCRSNGIHMTREIPQRSYILQTLAQEGSKLINDQNLETDEYKLVINYLNPISRYLGEPKILGIIAQEIKELPQLELEFALTLISQWEGTLPQLILAAKKVVG